MNQAQFQALAGLLSLQDPILGAARDILVDGQDVSDASQRHGCPPQALQQAVARMRHADAAVRQAYVVHGPTEFRITVGHRDTHRWPGSLQLAIRQEVRLVAHTTERWIPVRITALPAFPQDYYRGVITAQLVANSKFQTGNAVQFSEDQVL